MDEHAAAGHELADDTTDGHARGGTAVGECQEALDTLYHFLDGELTDQRRHDIQHHLDECSPCLEAFDFEAELKEVVARRCKESVPEALRLRIAIALDDASKRFPGPEEGAHIHRQS